MPGIKRAFSLVPILVLGLLLIVFFLYVDQPLDDFPDNLSVTAPSKNKGKDNEHFELALIEILEDQTPPLHPLLLWFDYKQNLLLWPVVADEITRSPPTASLTLS